MGRHAAFSTFREVFWHPAQDQARVLSEGREPPESVIWSANPENPGFDNGSPDRGKFSGFEVYTGCEKSMIDRIGRLTILEVIVSI